MCTDKTDRFFGIVKDNVGLVSTDNIGDLEGDVKCLEAFLRQKLFQEENTEHNDTQPGKYLVLSFQAAVM